MIIENGIVYADDKKPYMEICGVRPLEDYRLWLRFSTGEARIADMKPFLDKPVFLPLRDKDVFRSVYLDYGTIVWNDGEIDFDPESLYEYSIPV